MRRMDPSRSSAQIPTYVKLLAVSIGLLVNFNVTSLREGPSPPLAAAASTLLIFPIFLFALPLPSARRRAGMTESSTIAARL
jgi:hypothetical protein